MHVHIYAHTHTHSVCVVAPCYTSTLGPWKKTTAASPGLAQMLRCTHGSAPRYIWRAQSHFDFTNKAAEQKWRKKKFRTIIYFTQVALSIHKICSVSAFGLTGVVAPGMAVLAGWFTAVTDAAVWAGTGTQNLNRRKKRGTLINVNHQLGFELSRN